MPRDAAAREALLDDLFVWLERQADGRMSLASFNLHRGRVWLWNAHDGLLGILSLTLRQYAGRQDCWQAHGLPRDLFYPAEQLHTTTEPEERYGGIVRVGRAYSPLQWQRRNHQGIETVRVPTEEERRARFAEECRRFADAVQRRIQELIEPGQPHDMQEVSRLTRLWREVAREAGRSSE